MSTSVPTTPKKPSPSATSNGESPTKNRKAWYEELVAIVKAGPMTSPEVLEALCTIEDEHLFTEDDEELRNIRSFFSNRMRWTWEQGTHCMQLMHEWRTKEKGAAGDPKDSEQQPPKPPEVPDQPKQHQENPGQGAGEITNPLLPPPESSPAMPSANARPAERPEPPSQTSNPEPAKVKRTDKRSKPTKNGGKQSEQFEFKKMGSPCTGTVQTEPSPVRCVTPEVINPEDNSKEEYWIDKIKAEAVRTIESIILTGKYLNEAKAKLGHGKWEDMLQSGRLPFGLRRAEQFMRIANNEGKLKTQNSALLPTSLDALYVLARLDADIIQKALASGTIRPDMTIAETKQFVLGIEGDRKIDVSSKPFDYEKVLDSVFKRVQKAIVNVPPDRFKGFLAALVKKIDGLEGD